MHGLTPQPCIGLPAIFLSEGKSFFDIVLGQERLRAHLAARGNVVLPGNQEPGLIVLRGLLIVDCGLERQVGREPLSFLKITQVAEP